MIIKKEYKQRSDGLWNEWSLVKSSVVYDDVDPDKDFHTLWIVTDVIDNHIMDNGKSSLAVRMAENDEAGSG